MKKIAVIGGGAAGIFFSILVKENNPQTEVVVFEKTSKLLAKVKISGGGRCNVTNACFEPSELIKAYPRGHKELLSAFHKFQPRDIIKWFEKRGVKLKTETDGRVFPITDKSETIVNCFLAELQKLEVIIMLNHELVDFQWVNEKFIIHFSNDFIYECDKILFAPGSSNSLWELLKNKGHTIIPPVPSLFTFNCNDELINGLSGIVVNNVKVSIDKLKFHSAGPLLITHWGLSGPAIIKLSSFAARELFEMNYNFTLIINWTAKSLSDVYDLLNTSKEKLPNSLLINTPLFNIPKRLWRRMITFSNLKDKKLNQLSKKEINFLANNLYSFNLKISGKGVFKEEFVTACGISLKEINFKTMESKIIPNIFFAGEFIDIDAITGGFNFQSAWTTAYIASQEVLT